MTRTPGVGIAGGGFGVRVLLPCLQAAGFDVRAVQSRDPLRIESQVRAQGVARVTSEYRSLLDDRSIDLVCVATEPELHATMAIAAMEAGKHLLCEKPLAPSAAEARIIADAAFSGAGLRGVDHELRFHPNFVRIRQVISDGDIGEVRYVVLRFSSSTRVDSSIGWSWWSDASAGGGQLNALGSHMVDAVQWWLADEIIDAKGTLATFTPFRRVPGTGKKIRVTSDEHAAFELQFSRGTTASVVVSAVDPTDAGLRCEIVGEHGTLVLDGFDALSLTLEHSRRRDMAVPDPLRDVPIVGLNAWRTSLVRFGQHLLNCIRDGTAYIGASLQDGVRIQTVLDTVRASAPSVIASTARYPSSITSGVGSA